MHARAPGPIVLRALRAPANLYDWNMGWILGERFLLLTHLGRRSGRRYRTMLEVIGRDEATGEFMVMAGLGRSAQWYRNLKARPALEVAVGRRRFQPDHRELDQREAEMVLTRYESDNRWVTPVIDRVLSWLVGWHYDGSEQARRRLAAELPVIALRPVDGPSGSTDSDVASRGAAIYGTGEEENALIRGRRYSAALAGNCIPSRVLRSPSGRGAGDPMEPNPGSTGRIAASAA
jgi:deazaflavin-dependent oxidoreductase (nitroreductase family)